ncbi:MAG TPA: redox-sensing transcriptional repressor Rex [Bacillota bacterium]|nr:redox-sensing transcriptional repressor Rex [Bacillota bacterium]
MSISELEKLYRTGRSAGHRVDGLIRDMEKYVQCSRVTPVVVAGVGKLGKALMSYAGFTVFELDVLAGFDVDVDIIKKGVCGKPVYPVEMLGSTCRRLGAKIGIVTVPGYCAQEVCDMLVDAGILAVWNFAAVRLTVPEHVMVINEDMSKSLVRLFEHVKEGEAGKCIP